MANNKEIKYEVKNNYIDVFLPLTSQGKFRCKKRDDIQKFGIGFAPKSEIITEDSYLEWQIGYDTPIGKNEKPTKLNKEEFKFIGANGKQKYPYELSELLYFMCKNNLITKEEILNIKKEVKDMDSFLQDKYLIDVKKEDPVNINKMDFLSSSTKLPTFIAKSEGSDLLVEIMIQKQQYATSVQPMLYLDTPVTAFINKDRIIGNTSTEEQYGIVRFDSSSKYLVFKLLKCFGMCSDRHNHDILKILDVIIKNVY